MDYDSYVTCAHWQHERTYYRKGDVTITRHKCERCGGEWETETRQKQRKNPNRR